MEVTAVKKQIQAKRLDNFFVFTGEEIEAQRIYVNKIAEVTGKPVKRIETVKEAFNRRASLLKVSYCFVCRDDAEFWKTATPFETVLELPTPSNAARNSRRLMMKSWRKRWRSISRKKGEGSLICSGAI